MSQEKAGFSSISKQSKLIFCLFFFLLVLTACEPAPVYRDVPQTTWQKLSGEQKKLIIDDSFQKFIGNDQTPKETKKVKK